MIVSANLGYPRIGPRRELKKALEDHWAGTLDQAGLEAVARDLRRDAWMRQREAGLSRIPSNDFTYYDHVLDTCAMVGAVPSRYGFQGERVDLATLFAMARGRQGVPAMEMTKWFDTNYHYIVPELEEGMGFRLASTRPMEAFREALALGIPTRPVLLGPVTFLKLGKPRTPGLDPLSLLDPLLDVYVQVLRALQAEGAFEVQVDEPVLVLDLDDPTRRAFEAAYGRLARDVPDLRLLVATYFGDLRDNLPLALSLPVAGLHVDLVRGAGQLDEVLAHAPSRLTLSLGVVDGRNVWRTDMDRALDLVRKAACALGADRVQVAPSCSLLHTPYDLEAETRLDPEVRPWLAFGRQKLEEVVALARLASGRDDPALEQSRRASASRRSSPRVHDPAVAARLASLTEDQFRRDAPFQKRRAVQQARLGLPLLPTTTIGSFPQTSEVRSARAGLKNGRRSPESYRQFMERQIADCVRFQEEAGIDVIVHGEFERSDMVEYFAEQLRGFLFTENGWVQSYGSRCVRPPVLFGDVSRTGPMTVEWSRYAQSLTDRPVKGMLTGPITLLQWSFVRDDQPRSVTASQLALAVRDEVVDLEAAGIGVIQIDEPAIREGLPLRRADRPGYLDTAVRAFRLASSGVRAETQIHTHMCYSEFHDILDAVAALDADALSIETSRSHMDLLGAFGTFRYPNGVGPGVYDIHSPRVPGQEEMAELLRKALAVLEPAQLWVNPDCGLKTRRWEEVRPALQALVEAARQVRAELGS